MDIERKIQKVLLELGFTGGRCQYKYATKSLSPELKQLIADTKKTISKLKSSYKHKHIHFNKNDIVITHSGIRWLSKYYLSTIESDNCEENRNMKIKYLAYFCKAYTDITVMELISGLWQRLRLYRALIDFIHQDYGWQLVQDLFESFDLKLQLSEDSISEIGKKEEESNYVKMCYDAIMCRYRNGIKLQKYINIEFETQILYEIGFEVNSLERFKLNLFPLRFILDN